MSSVSASSEQPPARRFGPVWPILVLAVALAWSCAIRVPLVMNARAHLDSDLAVDGLTLLEMTQGTFRWHYPGTPHIGILPAFASLPQALIWGATPETLVSGGLVLQALVMIACFALAWRCDGPAVACWSLVPLTFASTGLIWLSGRITGGHLLAVAMLAGLYLGFHLWVERPSLLRTVLLGIWAGVGLWVDYMLLLGIVALAPSAFYAWNRSRPPGPPREAEWQDADVDNPDTRKTRRRLPLLILVLVFLVGLQAGFLPKRIGDWREPYDAYHEQFRVLWETRVLQIHARLLLVDCLPRLVLGHRLPRLQSDPLPHAIPTSRQANPTLDLRGTFAEIPAHAAGLLFLAGLICLVLGKDTIATNAVKIGLGVTMLLVIVTFILNRNIFNSDNYRYLVFLIVPWSLGCGRALGLLARKGTGGVVGAFAFTLAFGVVMTLDVAHWYEGFGWIEKNRPVRAHLERPALDWIKQHPEVDGLIGGYWDAYLYSFLMEGKLKSVPFPIYPNRFPEWSAAWPDGRPHYLILSRGRESNAFRSAASRAGGELIFQGGNIAIFTWPGSRPIEL